MEGGKRASSKGKAKKQAAAAVEYEDEEMIDTSSKT
jgi:hypothetical protein